MGVPAFYRWLSERYPKIVHDVIEDEPQWVAGEEIPVDTTQPNPNGEEFDNLYLDMNGIIHPCFHPEDRPAPTTESEVFICIFDYIDRLFAMIRPRKVLFMAIDGVAPRAKMNQQRARRFKAAQEAEEKKVEEAKLKEEFRKQGIIIKEDENQNEVFDSNTITPGTPFMHRLSMALQYYIHKRLNEDPGWAGVEVILSDANIPGEGEHKVVEYIRLQRGLKGWDPNTKHVLYGLDADLIMLALATHEPHFCILREMVFNKKPSNNQQDRQSEMLQKAEEAKDGKGGVSLAVQASRMDRKPFQLVKVAVLREYLALDLGCHDQVPFQPDDERVLDDFVFLCFFCGNDFLPHMPTLEIREGAIDLLMSVYRKMLPQLGGYMCHGSAVNLERVEKFVKEVAKAEQAIFQKRAVQLDRQKSRRRRDNQWKQRNQQYANQQRNTALAQKAQQMAAKIAPAPSNNDAALALKRKLAGKGGPGPEAKAQKTEGGKQGAGGGRAGAAAEAAAEAAAGAAAESAGGEEADAETKAKFKETLNQTMRDKSDMFDSLVEQKDKVRLTEEGWRERYYEVKFGVAPGPEQEEVIKQVAYKFVEGLCWVMKYYYDGVQSWKWYFPYHYAPFASDLVGIGAFDIQFEMGEPFKPFEQLMGVLPAASGHALPQCYRELMSAEDSPILDFYPTEFKCDMNGKRFAWQAVVLLPWIDEQRLLDAVRPREERLNEEEKRRNSRLSTLIFVAGDHPLAAQIKTMDEMREKQGLTGARLSAKIDPAKSKNMNGIIELPNGEVCPDVIHSNYEALEDLKGNRAVTAIYRFPAAHPHEPLILDGTVLPPRQVYDQHVPPPAKLWHEGGGRGGRGGGGPRGPRPGLPNMGGYPGHAPQPQHPGQMGMGGYGQGHGAYPMQAPPMQPGYAHPGAYGGGGYAYAQRQGQVQQSYAQYGGPPMHPGGYAHPYTNPSTHGQMQMPGGYGMAPGAYPPGGYPGGPPPGYGANNPYAALQQQPPPGAFPPGTGNGHNQHKRF